LATQIREGAPADLFISAAEKQVNELIDAKAADAAVAGGHRFESARPDRACRRRKARRRVLGPGDARVKRIAIGQPATVPAGEYAAQVLKEAERLRGRRERLIYGTNVRQVLDYVRRSEVDAGVVYCTDAMTEAEGESRCDG
jgi:molybdate transport system substrate-binding protein